MSCLTHPASFEKCQTAHTVQKANPDIGLKVSKGVSSEHKNCIVTQKHPKRNTLEDAMICVCFCPYFGQIKILIKLTYPGAGGEDSGKGGGGGGPSSRLCANKVDQKWPID
jgi:hypothetical protein